MGSAWRRPERAGECAFQAEVPPSSLQRVTKFGQIRICL